MRSCQAVRPGTRAVMPLVLFLSFLVGACASVDIDRDRLPLGAKGKARFDHYLSLEFEKAFAVTPPGGRWWFSWGWPSQGNASTHALEGCERMHKTPCELLAEGDTIVGKHLLTPKRLPETSANTVSLEEAKRITADLEGASNKPPPPRTVNGLLTISAPRPMRHSPTPTTRTSYPNILILVRWRLECWAVIRRH